MPSIPRGADDQACREHGGLRGAELEALGLSPSNLLDFSVNVNPYGPSPGLVDAIRAAPLGAYPDPGAFAARTALAAATGRTLNEVVLGAGATELFWTFARTVLDRESSVVVAAPCFGEFAAAAAAVGARVVAVRGDRARQFDVDPEALIVAARAARAATVHMAAPTSPVGRAVAPDVVRAVAEALPDTFVLFDESFLALSERAADLEATYPPNVVRVRSLTKDHALAGLRVGYMLADAGLSSRMETQRPAWTTGTLTQAAAVASCAPSERAFVAVCRERLLQERAELTAEFVAHGFEPVPSIAPYFVVPVGSGAEVRRRLLTRGILVRDCASFGLPECIRVAAHPAGGDGRNHFSRLMAALTETHSAW